MRREILAAGAWRRLSSGAGAVRTLCGRPGAVLSGLVVLAVVVSALLAPAIAPYSYERQDRASLLAPPDAHHRLGTDDLGQDVLSRLIYASRVSLAGAAIVQVIGVALGVAIGLLAACKGGGWDSLLMRFTDAMFAFPDLLFAILLVGMLQPASPLASFVTVFLALALVSWPGMARLARASALVLRETDYVAAARALGMSEWGIVRKHLLPNMLGVILVAVTVDLANVILAEATLSFLGIGIQRPYPSWGRMIYDGLTYLSSMPMLVFYPSLMLAGTVLAFNFLGDALRDTLDPRLRGVLQPERASAGATETASAG